MCVIIKREPGVIIPEEKIWSACQVNSDGFGLSIIDRGKIETIKIYNPNGNDATEVLKRLEDAKFHKVFLHLRFTTAGKSNEENCHPFKTLEDGPYEIQFMHNGTLSKFKNANSDLSDTVVFNNEILKPTFDAFYNIDAEQVLQNLTLKKILEEFKGASVFTFYDTNGKELILENTSCKDHKGWWSSNEYSFNNYHRSNSSKTYSYYPTNAKNNNNVNNPIFEFEKEMEDVEKKYKTKTEQAKETGFAIVQARKRGLISKHHTPPQKRVTFTELTSIDHLKDVMVLNEEELYDLCNEKPIVATALIMDLIYELYTKVNPPKEGH